MPKTTLYPVNAVSGAYTQVACQIPSHTVQITEDGSVAAQGLEIQFPSDNYATTATYGAGQVVELAGHGTSGVLGYPAGGTYDGSPADVYCRVRSATATATTIRVVETEVSA